MKPRTVAVVGGGISGLVAAWRIHEVAPDAQIKLFEASGRVGGVLETIHEAGFLIERSADNFISQPPWAVEFCRRIGLEDQLLQTSPAQRRAFVVRKGRLCPVPDGFQIMAPGGAWPLLRSPVLSWRGKLRLGCERFVPRRPPGSKEESLAEFATRRLGREAYERLVQPLIGGIYTADPERLSVAATMPRFLEMESKYGSLTRGVSAGRVARRSKGSGDSGARYSLFVTLRNGMGSLVETIRDTLPEDTVQLNTAVQSVGRAETGTWTLQLSNGGETFSCDRLVIATRGPVASRLVEALDAELSADLRAIPYAGCAVVCLGYREDQLQRPLEGFGFVVPAIEHRRILAGSFSSSKYVGRAPDGHVLIRCFLGGACQPELLELDDDRLRTVAQEELHALIGAQGRPVISRVVRWDGAMPQYHVGHVELVERVSQRVAALPGLAIVGNAYHGVGVPHCIHHAETAVDHLFA